METKIFEVRDRATLIPMVGIKCQGDHPLMCRAGYGQPMILFGALDGGHFHYDPIEQGNRSRTVSHRYIAENWDNLKSGQVIDVEFILGESQVEKQSEYK